MPGEARIATDCLLGLGMIAGGAGSTTEIRFQLDGDYSAPQVRRGLYALAGRRPPLVVQVSGGQHGPAWPTVWRLTDAGRAELEVLCGEDEPGREPCGVGWPR